MADEAYHIGPSIASESYLDPEKLIQAAKRSGADAIHPGYGFLSENPDFAERVIQSNIQFIGPHPDSIRTIGDKMAAKLFITQHLKLLPLIPGYHGEDQSIERLEEEAKKIEFPVLLKAAAGGGGKGMRVVYEPKQLKQEIEAAKGESVRSFGSDKLLIEKYFTSIRHVEIQIFGDKHGNVYHINERDCSIQRRHQKIVEETPSPAMDPPLRQAMTHAAVELGRKLKYVGAGTAEFILDEKSRRFYFLELNTRLQVEHPVTEAISGLDLVELQILVAQGAYLKDHLSALSFQGHAIEVRLCAEEPDDDFSPRTGTIIKWSPPQDLAGVRFDTGVQDGSEISVYYDSMIAKIIVHAPTRAEAVRRMITVLKRTVISGLSTNQSFLLSIMMNPCFQSGTFDTGFIHQQELVSALDSQTIVPNAIAAFLVDWFTRYTSQVYLKNLPMGWRNVRWQHRNVGFTIARGNQEIQIYYEYLGKSNNKHEFKAQVTKKGEDIQGLSLAIVVNDPQLSEQRVTSDGIQGSQGLLRYEMNGEQFGFYAAEDIRDVNDKSIFVHDFLSGQQNEFIKVDRLKSKSAAAEDNTVTPYITSMPCRILKILVPTGTLVEKNTPLLSIESMKTEIKIISQTSGIFNSKVQESQLVDAKVLLCTVDKQ